MSSNNSDQSTAKGRDEEEEKANDVIDVLDAVGLLEDTVANIHAKDEEGKATVKEPSSGGVVAPGAVAVGGPGDTNNEVDATTCKTSTMAPLPPRVLHAGERVSSKLENVMVVSLGGETGNEFQVTSNADASSNTMSGPVGRAHTTSEPTTASIPVEPPLSTMAATESVSSAATDIPPPPNLRARGNSTRRQQNPTPGAYPSGFLTMPTEEELATTEPASPFDQEEDVNLPEPPDTEDGRFSASQRGFQVLASAHLVIENEEEENNHGSSNLRENVTSFSDPVFEAKAVPENKLRNIVVGVLVAVVILVLILAVALSNRDSGGEKAEPNAQPSNDTTTLAPSISEVPYPQLPPLIRNPLGETLFGDKEGDAFGNAMAMASAMNNTLHVLVVGQSQPKSRTIQSDVVKVFAYKHNEKGQRQTQGWAQVGPSIVGDSPEHSFGASVAIAAVAQDEPNGGLNDTAVTIIVACGVPDHGGLGTTDNARVGLVRAYKTTLRNGETTNAWEPVGQDLNGLGGFDQWGTKVALSQDGSVLVASAARSNSGRGPGYVQIFQLDSASNSWVGMPVKTNHQSNGDDLMTVIQGDDQSFGESLSIAGNGKVLAIGAPTQENETGAVLLYHLNDEAIWTPMPVESTATSTNRLKGGVPGDKFGSSVSLSHNGTCLAVGALGGTPSGGYSRVYCLQEGSDGAQAWEVRGKQDALSGGGDGFASSIALASIHSDRLVVGAPTLPSPDPIASDDSSFGQAFVFQFNGGSMSWELVRSEPLKGFEAGDQFGSNVAISPDGRTVVGTSPFGRNRRDPLQKAGYVRAYRLFGTDERLTLQISASSDNESYLQDANTLEKRVLNYAALHSGLSHVMAAKEGMYAMHLNGGDVVLSNKFFESSLEVPEFEAAGVADILMWNAMNLDGLVIGSNDLYAGIDSFAAFIARAKFPILTVNYDLSDVQLRPETPRIQLGRDASDCSHVGGMVVKSCYYNLGPLRVGLVGNSPPDILSLYPAQLESLPGFNFFGGYDNETYLPSVSSRVEQIMQQVGLLQEEGVRIIVLLDREGRYVSDREAASEFHSIDIIVSNSAGNNFVAQPEANGPFNFLRDGDSVTVPAYPLVLEDSVGDSVLVIKPVDLYSYIGNLIVDFDMAGNILGWDQERAGPIATTSGGISEMSSYLGIKSLEPPQEVTDIFNKLTATQTINASFSIIGETRVPLMVFPSNDSIVETNLRTLVADAFLWGGRQLMKEAGAGHGVDVSFVKGNIRGSIVGPKIIRLSLQTALPFGNTIRVLQLSLDQLLAVMENASGRSGIPSIAGMKMVFDESKLALTRMESVTTPSRVQFLAVCRDGICEDESQDDILVDDFVVQTDDFNETFTVAVARYLAGGADGFTSFGAASVVNETSLAGSEILEQYIEEVLGGVVDIENPPLRPRLLKATSE